MEGEQEDDTTDQRDGQDDLYGPVLHWHSGVVSIPGEYGGGFFAA
jgi:hypothetical protein